MAGQRERRFLDGHGRRAAVDFIDGATMTRNSGAHHRKFAPGGMPGRRVMHANGLVLNTSSTQLDTHFISAG
jgi:hypothetical protein